MWYSKIIESATAWDVLSTKEVSWAGSFSRTFQDFQFYDPNKMPTMTAMLKLIGEIEKGKGGDSILDKYFEKAKTDYTATNDIKIFCHNLSKFIDNEMKKQGSSANTDMIKVLELLGNLNEFLKSKGDDGLELGQRIPDYENLKYAVNSTLGMGFTTLNLLMRKGTNLSESLGMFIIRGDDITKLGYSPSQQREILIYQILEARPELYNFQNQESVVNLIRRGEGEFYFPQIQEYIFSGIDENKVLQIVFELLFKSFSQEKVASLLSGFPDKYRLSVAIKIEEYPEYKQFCQILAEKLYSTIRESDFNSDVLFLRKLKSFKTFIELLKSKGDECEPLFIIKGLVKPETIIRYLDKNPEDYEKFDINLLNSLGEEVKNRVFARGRQAKEKIQNDGFAALERAQVEKVIEVKKATDTSYNWAYGKNPNKQLPTSGMSESELRQRQKTDEVFNKFQISYEDRMKQESPFAGISEENIQKYADQMVIVEFNTWQLKDFMRRNNIPKLKLGPVDFTDEKWGGLFVPRFPTKDRGPVPAIIIKTDIYAQLEYHQALAENIGMDAQHYLEATKRHEVAHALQYLHSGDLMMQDSVELNPELTPEEAYISDPAELYARVHGDIPYLTKIFDAHIGKLMSDPKIYQAAKEQWILDIQDEMVHLMSGGTNAKRLLEDMETGRFGAYTTSTGQTIKLSDPLEAINKMLQRQRNRLEMIFHETFQIQGRRDYRRGLISKKNQLIQEIESTPLYELKRTELEKELKEVETKLVESGRMLIFDVKDVTESVIEGYLSDYFGKIAKAVADGLLTTDIVNPEGADRQKENEQLREQAKKQEPPTAQDIKQHARFQIQQSEPIPSGRKLDVILPRFKGEGMPPGNFPGFENAKQDDKQVDITIEREPEKTSSVYNYRKLIK
jgi:hypothetical protein